MPFAVGDIYRVRLFSKLGNQLGVNVLHYRCYELLGTAFLESVVADGAGTVIGPKMRDLLVAEATYAGLSIQRIYPTPIGVQTFSTSGSGAGTVGGGALPKQSCGVLSLKTEFSGPRYRGRVYVPFPAENSNAGNGLPTAGYVEDLQDLAGVLPTAMNQDLTLTDYVHFRHVVWSAKYGLPNRVLVYTPRYAWGTQRRRGDFGATNVSPV